MKLGKTLVSFLSASMVVALAACGGGESASLSESASESPSDSGSVAPETRPWSAHEQHIQQRYLKTVLPELPVPNDESTVVSFYADTELEEGYYNLVDTFDIAFTPSESVSAAIIATLTSSYGEPASDGDVYEWEILGGVDDCFTAYVDLTVSTGKIECYPYTFTQAGMEYWLDGNILNSSSGELLVDDSFADLYPGFPLISGSDALEAQYGAWNIGEEDVSPVVAFGNQTAQTFAAATARLETAGWRIYHWAKSSGGFNSYWYTKPGVEGAFQLDDYFLADYGYFDILFLSGYSAAKYGQDDPSWVDSSSVVPSVSSVE